MLGRAATKAGRATYLAIRRLVLLALLGCPLSILHAVPDLVVRKRLLIKPERLLLPFTHDPTGLDGLMDELLGVEPRLAPGSRRRLCDQLRRQVVLDVCSEGERGRRL